MKTCVFPGSFDPITCGHLNLIRRAAGVFDRVTVTVMVNRAKTGTIPAEERLRLIRKACAEIPNVEADLWNGLLADYMTRRSAMRKKNCRMRNRKSLQPASTGS